jgi:hypothetical protein
MMIDCPYAYKRPDVTVCKMNHMAVCLLELDETCAIVEDDWPNGEKTEEQNKHF